MRIGDVISISDFPAVVVLADVAALKERLDAESPPSADTEARLRTYVEHYFIDEPENRAACEDILGSLARTGGPGAAFLVRGVYGSGKSHLLSVVSLLAEYPDAWLYFLAGHAEFRQVARCFSPERRLLLVQIALDEFRGQSQALEDVVLGAVQRELTRPKYGLRISLSDPSHAIEVARRFLIPRYRDELDRLASNAGASWDGLAESQPTLAASLAQRLCEELEIPLVFTRSRAEALGLLLERMKEQGLAGLVILLDELSLFLAGKNKRDLDADASFLQFLAQRAARQPIWLLASTQRPLEDLGDIDTHTLRQISDRFTTHSLSLAQLRTVLDRKVVQKNSPTYRSAVADLYASFAEGNGPCFSQEDLVRLYPLNPLALDCLVGLADSFLSKTRSLIQFVQAQWPALADEDHGRLLCGEDVFDFFWPKMQRLPEARPYAAAFTFLEEHLRKMGLDSTGLATALAKGLTLSGMAGLRWSVREHADALLGSRCCKGQRPACLQVQQVLDTLHRRGAYVEVSRQSEQVADIYFLDVATDASELVRRRLDEILSAFEPDDGRVLECAYQACSHDILPLVEFKAPRVVPVEHLNVRRWARLSLLDLRRVGAGDLSNAATLLQNPQGEEDACLFIATLFGTEQQRDAWRQAAAAIEGRFAAGLLAWVPGPAGEHDITILREHAALCLMLDDPVLKQGRKGSEMRRLAMDRRQGMQDEVRALMTRLYMEGEILSAPAVRSAPPPSLNEGWNSTVSSVLRPAFESLFPCASSVAPGRPLSGRLHVNQIISQFLRAPQPAVLPGSALEAHLRDFLAPMGLVEKREGKWAVCSSAAPIVDGVMSCIPEEGSISFADLAGALRKSSFGLTGEQTELAVAGMARAGWLTPLDAFLSPIKFEDMGLPLPDHAPFWGRARLMAAEKEQAALELARLLFDWGIERLDPPTQRSLWDRTQSWAEGARSALPRCRQEVDSLVAALGQQRLQWTETYRVIGQAGAFVSKFPSGASAAEGLEGLLEIAGQLENGASDLRGFGVVQRFAREHAAEIARIHRYASDGRLHTMPGSLLERQRAKLRDSLGGGEAIVENAEQVVKAGREFIRSYCREYVAWHAQAHSPAHFKPYLEAKDSDWHAALAALSQARLDEGGALADVRRLLAQALEKHCTGENLPAALGDSPVCPQCGIAMGQRPELPAIDEIERRARDGIRAAGSILKREDVRERVVARLREAPTDVSERAGGLLTMREEAEPADVVSSCTPEVAQWLNRVLAKPAASRSIESFIASIRGRRLSKRELVRLFFQWLDPEGALSDEDYVDVE